MARRKTLKTFVPLRPRIQPQASNPQTHYFFKFCNVCTNVLYSKLRVFTLIVVTQWYVWYILKVFKLLTHRRNSIGSRISTNKWQCKKNLSTKHLYVFWYNIVCCAWYVQIVLKLIRKLWKSQCRMSVRTHTVYGLQKSITYYEIY